MHLDADSTRENTLANENKLKINTEFPIVNRMVRHHFVLFMQQPIVFCIQFIFRVVSHVEFA